MRARSTQPTRFDTSVGSLMYVRGTTGAASRRRSASSRAYARNRLAPPRVAAARSRRSNPAIEVRRVGTTDEATLEVDVQEGVRVEVVDRRRDEERDVERLTGPVQRRVVGGLRDRLDLQGDADLFEVLLQHLAQRERERQVCDVEGRLAAPQVPARQCFRLREIRTAERQMLASWKPGRVGGRNWSVIFAPGSPPVKAVRSTA